ncbi:MAG: MFS transporter [Flavipsychrobacter sp.]|nr:MFS transporter [Flavipsychrobacter sp.]
MSGFINSFLNKNKALRVPEFRYYLLMRLSLIGALNMQSAIIAYYVYKLTHDKLALGMIGLWEVIPAIGFSLFSGHFVDLREKRAMLLGCFSAYLLLSALFVTLALPQVVNLLGVRSILWLLYAGVFVGGALRAFASPSTFALMGLILPKDLYATATTWSSASWQAGAVLGPLAGGFMLAWSGFTVSLIWVAVIQILGIIATLRIPRQPIMNKAKEPVLKSLGEGLRFVFSTQVVLAALSLDMFAVLFGGAVALLPVYAEDILKVGELGYGWLRAAPGIGSVLCLILVSFFPLRRNAGSKLMWSLVGFGATTVVFGLCGYFGTEGLFSVGGFAVSAGFLVAFVMLLAGGMFDAVSVVIRGTILHLHTPDEMRGRVAAVNTMFISSSNELGAMESGVTARMMGTVPAVVFGGIMTILVVAVTWFAAPAIRTLKLYKDE